MIYDHYMVGVAALVILSFVTALNVCSSIGNVKFEQCWSSINISVTTLISTYWKLLKPGWNTVVRPLQYGMLINPVIFELGLLHTSYSGWYIHFIWWHIGEALLYHGGYSSIVLHCCYNAYYGAISFQVLICALEYVCDIWVGSLPRIYMQRWGWCARCALNG